MSYVVDGCNVVATEHTRYGLSYTYVETVECMSSAGYVCCGIILLLDMADMDGLLCGGLWNEQCHVHSVGVDRVNVSSQVAYFSSALICVQHCLSESHIDEMYASCDV